MNNVKIWYQRVPLWTNVFWLVAMVMAIAICISISFAFWKFGFLGGVAVGFILSKILER